jgi:flagellar basal-body rod protein FlgB
MQDMAIFAIASQRTRWLATSSANLASNIANADTPGYVARDVVPFDTALASAGLAMSQTTPGHVAPSAAELRVFETVPRDAAAGKHSGNSVSLDTELMSLGEVRSEHMKVTGVVGAFNRMLMSISKA